MKKAITRLFAVLLLFATLLSVASCEKKNDGKYHVFGLHYDIGEEYKEINVPYSENCYTNGESYFFFVVYSAEGLEEIGVAGDISVELYMQSFLVWNYQSPTNYTYDKEKNIATTYFISSDMLLPEDVEESEPEFLYHMVLRGASHLYIITMSCSPDVKDKCLPEFEAIAATIWAD